MYNSTNGASWNNSVNWLSIKPVSTWFGIVVTGTRVTTVNLHSNNLSGTIPSSVGNLTALTLFYSLAEVRTMSEEWRTDYNIERPHKSSGYQSPLKFAEQHYKSTEPVHQLYPQTANINTLLIEESCFVDKVAEKQKDD